MTDVSSPAAKLGVRADKEHGTWVQTERKAHEAWARLSLRKPRAAALMHHLVARMGGMNAVVVSQKTLAALMGAHERTIQRAVSDLVEENWIQVVKLHGPGTVSAYVVNDQVAFQGSRDNKRFAIFSAAVVVDVNDQDAATLQHKDLRRIPVLFAGEQQLPHGEGEDPPSQPNIDGFEPNLPALSGSDFDDRAALEKLGQQRLDV